MKNKTSEDLINIVNDRAFFSVEKRYEALCELEKRDLLNAEMKQLKADIEYEMNRKDDIYDVNTDLEHISNDPNAPKCYHTYLIYTVSVSLSVFAGSILISKNLKALNKKLLSIIVLVVGLVGLCTSVGLFIYIRQQQVTTAWLLYAINGLISAMIIELFWRLNLKKGVSYRSRLLDRKTTVFLLMSVAAVLYVILKLT